MVCLNRNSIKSLIWSLFPFHGLIFDALKLVICGTQLKFIWLWSLFFQSHFFTVWHELSTFAIGSFINPKRVNRSKPCHKPCFTHERYIIDMKVHIRLGLIIDLIGKANNIWREEIWLQLKAISDILIKEALISCSRTSRKYHLLVFHEEEALNNHSFLRITIYDINLY